MPIAPGLKDSESVREKYFDIMLKRLENYTGQNIREHIEYKRSYCVNDFVNDYNAYKGNAYGLANTLLQTANFKPKIINKKINNLFYTGQLTVPGPGVPLHYFGASRCKTHCRIQPYLIMKYIFDNVSDKCSKLTTIAYSTSF